MKKISNKQLEILKIIVRANPDGSLADINQIMERASYGPTKDALQFTIKQLMKMGYIEKRDPEVRRGSLRIIYNPTMEGLSVSRTF